MSNKEKKILIVEDDTSLSSALEKTLRKEGYQVETAFNGREALLLAEVERPDLILLDLFMPVMDGHEFLNNLRADPWGRSARVIILSNESMADPRVATTVIKQKPLYFFVKSATQLKDLVNYVNETLA